MNVVLKDLSQHALAYLGDSVIELKVRTMLVEKGLAKSKSLNSAALEYVTATAQAQAADRLLPYLDEEEQGVFRRGRNSNSGNVPKSATCFEYKKATGLEALFGYLYLAGRTDRVDELFKLAYPDAADGKDTE
jgi:ribonuclease-3 family protein